jgi:uncharacterized protein
MENNNLQTIPDAEMASPQPKGFLSLPSGGMNSWWRYALSIFTILFAWQIIGSIPYAVIIALGLSQNNLPAFIAVNFSFICLVGSILFCVRFIHHRKPVTLITTEPKMSFRRFWIAAGWWSLVVIAITILDALVHPGSYKLTFELKSWIPFLIAAVILTPIQTSGEELLFRGYLLQTLGFLTKKKWILVIISGVIFAVPHFLNPEMKQGFVLLALYYFSFGAILTLITLKSNRLEYAMGIHAANNLLTVLLANYTDSALPSPSIFTATILDPVFNIVSFLLGMGLLWLLLFKLRPGTGLQKNSQPASDL